MSQETKLEFQEAETVETRTEYRVVGEHHDGRRIANCPTRELAEVKAEELASGTALVAPYKNLRIQTRTVTATPWEDVTATNQETKGERNG